MPTIKKCGERTRERSAFWRVSERTMQKWLAASPPVPVDDIPEMLRWVAAMPSLSQSKLTRSFRLRVDELRIERERETGAVFVTDPDYLEFEKTHTATSTSESDNLAQQKIALGYATWKLRRAQARGDLAAIKDATEALRHISGVIRADELAAQRLNREIGETVPKADVLRMARAIAYWLVRGVDELHAAIDRPIAAAASGGPLIPETIRALLEPYLLSHRVLQPFVRATQVSAPVALPAWFVDAVRDAFDSTLEDGAAEFNRLYATPVPSHPMAALDAASTDAVASTAPV